MSDEMKGSQHCPICGGDVAERSSSDTIRCGDCGVSFFFSRGEGHFTFDTARARGILNRVARETQRRADRLEELRDELTSYGCARTPEEILRDAGVDLSEEAR
jgi:ribosomal protein L37AE/L43A